jgi:uncharacterized protein YbbK (DUF523 family)
MSAPVVLISRCLLGTPCRYDGACRPAAALALLPAHWTRLDLCPEEDLGMGVPRSPIGLVLAAEGPRLKECRGPRDWTREMADWCRLLARILLGDGAAGAVLKARSPSCGRGDVELFADEAALAAGHAPLGRGADGFLVRALQAADPAFPLINDEELADEARRLAFAAAVEARHASRAAGRSATAPA